MKHRKEVVVQKQISISNEFFKKERNNYSNWGMAFWRELFQNSIDAGSSEITVNINNDTVGFIDNGCGMSREVLEDVYFCLGKTTKDNTDTVGGFGKARILTCFSHNSYSLRSQNWVASGSGSLYEVEDRDDYVRGCEVKIDIDASNVNLQYDLYQYLSLSQFSCRVKSNLPDIDNFKQWLYRRSVSRRLSFGNIHVNKSGKHSGTLIVRVDGVPMFTKYLIVPYQIILEIDKGKSREVLLSNRDSLHSSYQNELDAFIQTINVDRKSLTSTRTNIEILGDGYFTSVPKPKFKIDNVVFAGEKEEEKELAVVTKDAAFTNTNGNFKRREDETSYDKQGNSSIHEFPRITIYKDCYSKEMKLAAYRYNPNNWRTGQGNNILKLLRMWTVACRYAVEVLMERTNIESVNWATGFIFNEEIEAMRQGNGVHNFLLRPVDVTGKGAFKLRSYASRMGLVSLAVHEVAHVVHSYHNEDYSSLLTDLSKGVFGKGREIQKEMSKVLK